MRGGASYVGRSIVGGGFDTSGSTLRDAGPGRGVDSSPRSRLTGRDSVSVVVGAVGAAAGTSAGARSSLDGTRMGRLLGAVSVEGGSTCVGVSVTVVVPPGCMGASTGARSPLAPPVTGTSRSPRDGRETAPVAGVPSLAPPAGFKVCGKRSRPFQPLVRRRSRSSGTPG